MLKIGDLSGVQVGDDDDGLLMNRSGRGGRLGTGRLETGKGGTGRVGTGVTVIRCGRCGTRIIGGSRLGTGRRLGTTGKRRLGNVTNDVGNCHAVNFGTSMSMKDFGSRTGIGIQNSTYQEADL